MNHLNEIAFVIGGKVKRISFEEQSLKPSTTVLDYLRNETNRKGTKEGCAEGDCGACTVVLASLKNSSICYEAIDSCLLFLPALHGKQLITIEDLAVKEPGMDSLHPVQQVLIDHSGTQCGFCTPGFTMALFAFFKNKKSKPDRKEIIDALSGNLCRCTGYQSIYKSVEALFEMNITDQFTEDESSTINLLEEIENGDLLLEGGGQIYYRATQLESAFNFLKQYPEATIVQGATDIALRQTKLNHHLPLILDLEGIKSLALLLENESYFTIGSGVQIDQACREIGPYLQGFTELGRLFGSKQIRNRATLGGNVATASPIGDSIPLLIAHKSIIEISSTGGTRQIPIEQFITGYRKTELKAGEIISNIIIPKKESSNQIRFYKISNRKHLDISSVSVAFRLILEDGIISDIIIAYGGMAATNQRARTTENYLIGKEWNDQYITQATELLLEEFTPISDARASAESRNRMAANLLIKFHEDLKNKGGSDV